MNCGGSSPLARGLQAFLTTKDFFVRIIPARAGFTDPGALWSAGFSDHPRSRGVYPALPGVAGLPPGSSPLARGLHLRTIPVSTGKGIIPARAGFTRPAVSLHEIL